MCRQCNRFCFSALLALFLVSIYSGVFADSGNCHFKPVTKLVYVMDGSNKAECPNKELEHPVNNPAIIVGKDGVIVIDPGSSLQVGRLVANRLQKITSKPVVAIFNTHIHGLYWLGNQGIKEQFPDARIYAHRRMIERIRNGEGDFCVNAITNNYRGEKTKFVVPDVALDGGEELRLAGVTLKIHHTGHAHTDHDIMIEAKKERTLFLGGVVVEPEVPSQGVPQDADFKGQMAATRYAIGLNMSKYVPGRGHPGGIELPQRGLKFAEALYDGVGNYYEKGLSDFEMLEKLKADLSVFKKWYDFSELGRVVGQMYLQVEKEKF